MSEEKDNWNNRSKGMICKTCVYFVEKKKDKVPVESEKVLGRCRRHCPTMNGFPGVFNTDWCGDHKLDENKI
jgi:hypothetical protein